MTIGPLSSRLDDSIDERINLGSVKAAKLEHRKDITVLDCGASHSMDPIDRQGNSRH